MFYVSLFLKNLRNTVLISNADVKGHFKNILFSNRHKNGEFKQFDFNNIITIFISYTPHKYVLNVVDQTMVMYTKAVAGMTFLAHFFSSL